MGLQEICRRVLGRLDLMESFRLPLAIITIFFAVWKIAGMPPGINGDWWDPFDDVVAGTGLASALFLLRRRRR